MFETQDKGQGVKSGWQGFVIVYKMSHDTRQKNSDIIEEENVLVKLKTKKLWDILVEEMFAKLCLQGLLCQPPT